MSNNNSNSPPAPKTDVKNEGSSSGYRRFNKGAKKTTVSIEGKTKFEGQCEKLKGEIYDCSFNQADLYVKTTRTIVNYIGTNYDNGDDLKKAIEAMKDIEIPIPADPPTGANRTVLRIWEKRVDEYVKRETAYEKNKKAAYSLVWGQCSVVLKSKLEGKQNYSEINEKADVIELLKNIKDITHNFQSEKFRMHALHEAKRRFYVFYQDRTSSVQTYLEKFRNMVGVIEHCGGGVIADSLVAETLTADDIANLTAERHKDIVNATKEKYLACAFLLSSDRTRYGKLIEDLENNYIQGVDKYPKTLNDAYSLLLYWKQDPRNYNKGVGSDSDGVAFLQNTEKEKKEITCYSCGEKGHIAPNCPKKKQGNVHVQLEERDGNQTGHSHLQVVKEDVTKDDEKEERSHLQIEENLLNSFDFCMVCSEIGEIGENCEEQEKRGKEDCEKIGFIGAQASKIPRTWIILDNGSTVDIFCNKDLLSNIRDSGREMKIRCNAGTTTTRLVGDLSGYGTVWYNPQGVANILSMSKVADKYRVTYDSKDSPSFSIHKEDGSIRTFQRDVSGLYYIDALESVKNMVLLQNGDTTSSTTKLREGVLLINTVREVASTFSKREYEQAKLARRLQSSIGYPSNQDMIELVKNNILINCPITVNDIHNAEEIFGPNLAALKGKSVRRGGVPVVGNIVRLPREIMDRYRSITLCGNVMFVNSVPFFVSVGKDIRFGTVAVLNDRRASTIMKSVTEVIRIYKKRGFVVDMVLMDGEFECLRGNLLDIGVELNTASRDEHVPQIERYIRTLKERMRCMYHGTPYKILPKIMLIEITKAAVFWLNSWPTGKGITSTISPRQAIVGTGISYDRHCKLEYGSYVQTNEQHSNNMDSRTIGAIALRPTGNLQGGFYFMSLDTGRRINRLHWTELPVPRDVIKRVQLIARNNGSVDGIEITDREGHAIHTEDDDVTVREILEPPAVDDNEEPFDDINEGLNDDIEVLEGNPEAEIPVEINNEIIDVPDNDDLDDVIPIEVDEAMELEINEDNEENDDSIDDVVNENINQPRPNIEEEMDSRYGARTGAYNLRPHRPRDYGHLHIALENVCMTQYSVKQGLKIFGMEGAKAVVAEMRQLEDRDVLIPRKGSMLSDKEKSSALQYLMFLKQKRCGKIKARGCADGRKQRIYKSKEETSTPTVAIESVMISCVIDAYERRVVATADVPGAFMHADMDETLFMRLEGPIAKSLLEINPNKYKDYVENENGKTILYVQLKKALYGTLQAALLFWKDLSGKLEKWGFEFNPYDNCVANKIINGKQCTILWHVDDLKISHVEEAVMDEVLK
jgi:Reverse transcriptase (RNA-dependent DNA polymerase)/Zinc knuckle